MFTTLDNKRDSVLTRQTLLESLILECQQPSQPKLKELIDYYFQTESPNALLLIKQFNQVGKEQSKILLEHLNNQGLKISGRYSSSNLTSDMQIHDDKERVAHTMKVFRLLCLIIQSRVPGLHILVKESALVSNCLQAIGKCKEDPNILAQACYFFAALTATLPSEIIQQPEQILNILKTTCKYLLRNVTSLRQLSIQTHAHSLENVQLWIVNQSAHALFYTLYTTYPCNFIHLIQREYQRNENSDIFEQILIPMFQRVRFNPRLIDSDRKRESDKDRRSRQDSYHIIYEARKLSLDPLFGRESPANSNWMHQEMKKILPFHQFKRQSPARSTDQLSERLRNSIELATPAESSSKRSGSSPFQRFKEKIKSIVRQTSSSSPSTTISTPDVDNSIGTTNTNSNNVLSIPNVSSSILTSPSPALGTDIRTVKTMPELQSNNDLSSSTPSTPLIQRSDQQYQVFVRLVIDAISSIHEQNLPSHWRKILGRYEPSLLVESAPQRYATFYVSPSEHSLDNQSHQHHRHTDDSSPLLTNERRERCASASCTSAQHVHSPVLAAPTTSTEDFLPRTQSLSTRQRTRHSTALSSSGSFHQRHFLGHQTQHEEDDNDDNVLLSQDYSMDVRSMHIPVELYINSETKSSIIDDLTWNDHDFIAIPHFDFNDIVTNNCSSNELKQFDRLYGCHSSYEVFLTDQYKKIWEHLWAKQKTYQKHLSDLQTARAFTDTLHLEVNVHLNHELAVCDHQSKCLSDENTLLGGKVVESAKVSSRRKQLTTNEDSIEELRELEKSCEQLRKTVNNETLKLNNLRTELDDHERESKLTVERSEQLKLITQNITHLTDFNQQLECQYLRFTDDVPVAMHSTLLSSAPPGEEDDEQRPSKPVPLTAANSHDEAIETDSISFNDEQRTQTDDLQQEQDDEQFENYDQLLMDIIELLQNQNTDNHSTQHDIEDKAYEILLEYMESKVNTQNYLLEHNTRYTDLYLQAQCEYIEQVEKELAINQSILKQMQTVAI